MVRGATGFLLACALWSGALIAAAVDGAGPGARDDLGSLVEDPALDLTTVHDEALADTRRVQIEEEPDEDADEEATGWSDDEVDLRWWDDGLDDDPDPGPPEDDGGDDLDEVLIDDIDEWLGPTDD